MLLVGVYAAEEKYEGSYLGMVWGYWQSVLADQSKCMYVPMCVMSRWGPL